MRKRIVEEDLVDAVIGLGRNLFYNSAMAACIVICRRSKSKNRKNKVLFVDASSEVREEKTQSWLDPSHIERIDSAYKDFSDVPEFAKVVASEEILNHEGSLNIGDYIPRALSRVDSSDRNNKSLKESWDVFEAETKLFWKEIDSLASLLSTSLEDSK